MGDYGSLLGRVGGMVQPIELAVTPLGQGPPSQSLDRVAMRHPACWRAHTCSSIDDGPVAGLINRPILYILSGRFSFYPSCPNPMCGQYR